MLTVSKENSRTILGKRSFNVSLTTANWFISTVFKINPEEIFTNKSSKTEEFTRISCYGLGGLRIFLLSVSFSDDFLNRYKLWLGFLRKYWGEEQLCCENCQFFLLLSEKISFSKNVFIHFRKVKPVVFDLDPFQWFNIFEALEEKTNHLCAFQSSLFSIQPTSTDFERAFTIARIFKL